MFFLWAIYLLVGSPPEWQTITITRVVLRKKWSFRIFGIWNCFLSTFIVFRGENWWYFGQKYRYFRYFRPTPNNECREKTISYAEYEASREKVSLLGKIQGFVDVCPCRSDHKSNKLNAGVVFRRSMIIPCQEKKSGWKILFFHDENVFSKFEIELFWKIFRTKNRKFEIFIF